MVMNETQNNKDEWDFICRSQWNFWTIKRALKTWKTLEKLWKTLHLFKMITQSRMSSLCLLLSFYYGVDPSCLHSLPRNREPRYVLGSRFVQICLLSLMQHSKCMTMSAHFEQNWIVKATAINGVQGNITILALKSTPFEGALINSKSNCIFTARGRFHDVHRFILFVIIVSNLSHATLWFFLIKSTSFCTFAFGLLD